MQILQRWLKPKKEPGSGAIARDRLKLVLVHNRLNMTPERLTSLKSDLISVLSEYFDIDADGIEVEVSRVAGQDELVTTIPLKLKRSAE